MIETTVNPENIKYVIVRKFCGYNPTSYEYVSQLAHEFKGAKEVVGYLPLANAIHYDSEEEAAAVLSSQPEWVQRDHKVLPFIKIGSYCTLCDRRRAL